MSISLIIFIIIHLIVLAFFVETVRRVLLRMREYPLEETPETLPFRSLRLKHILILYVLAYILWIASSLWLYHLFLGGVTPVGSLNL